RNEPRGSTRAGNAAGSGRHSHAYKRLHADRDGRVSTETLPQQLETMSHLALSVVVPVRNGAVTLPNALRAILASDLPRERFELIVVDDGSTDGSAGIAGRHADTVVRLAVQRPG